VPVDLNAPSTLTAVGTNLTGFVAVSWPNGLHPAPELLQGDYDVTRPRRRRGPPAPPDSNANSRTSLGVGHKPEISAQILGNRDESDDIRAARNTPNAAEITAFALSPPPPFLHCRWAVFWSS
jgi:hypothetical protein